MDHDGLGKGRVIYKEFRAGEKRPLSIGGNISSPQKWREIA
jgi:hypothetical protein